MADRPPSPTILTIEEAQDALQMTLAGLLTGDPTDYSAMRAAADKAEALAASHEALRAERDEAQEYLRDLENDPDRPLVVYAGDELEAAERRVAELEAAIGEAIRLTGSDGESYKRRLSILRAALSRGVPTPDKETTNEEAT